MIGANCSKAIEPIEIIPSQQCGPYAFRAILGFWIVGSLGRKMGQPILHCNIIKCSSFSTNQMAKHVLAVETQVEDIGFKEMLQKLYNEEFNEVHPERKNWVFGELESLSAEDKQLMMMVENGAKFVNGHYQLLLSLTNPALIMPNNRTMVEKRANYLKRQFMKNEKFLEDYQKFMNDILQKGYARVASEIQP